MINLSLLPLHSLAEAQTPIAAALDFFSSKSAALLNCKHQSLASSAQLLLYQTTTKEVLHLPERWPPTTQTSVAQAPVTQGTRGLNPGPMNNNFHLIQDLILEQGADLASVTETRKDDAGGV